MLIADWDCRLQIADCRVEQPQSTILNEHSAIRNLQSVNLQSAVCNLQ